jgi:hypothetical protein
MQQGAPAGPGESREDAMLAAIRGAAATAPGRKHLARRVLERIPAGARVVLLGEVRRGVGVGRGGLWGLPACPRGTMAAGFAAARGAPKASPPSLAPSNHPPPPPRPPTAAKRYNRRRARLRGTPAAARAANNKTIPMHPLPPALSNRGPTVVVTLPRPTPHACVCHSPPSPPPKQRAEVTRLLVEERGFNAVMVESDWPGAGAAGPRAPCSANGREARRASAAASPAALAGRRRGRRQIRPQLSSGPPTATPPAPAPAPRPPPK